MLEALRSDERPKLFLWADSDPILPLRPASACGGDRPAGAAHDRDASHFLQEDQGPLIGETIAGWLTA